MISIRVFLKNKEQAIEIVVEQNLESFLEDIQYRIDTKFPYVMLQGKTQTLMVMVNEISAIKVKRPFTPSENVVR